MWVIPAKFRLDIHYVGHVVTLPDQVVGHGSPHMSHSDNSYFLLLRWGGKISANIGRTSFDFQQLTTQHFCKLCELWWKLNCAQCLYKIIVGVVLVSPLVAKWVLSEIFSTNKTYFIFILIMFTLSNQNYEKATEKPNRIKIKEENNNIFS